MTSSSNTFTAQSRYDFPALLDCAEGKLFGEGNPQLPKPPMLMFDEISLINADGGKYKRGYVHAKLAITPEKWFFGCHFHNDPVMPGCLGLDAMWQLIGFYLGWCGYRGNGRALGCGNVRFSGQVLPNARVVEYIVDIKKIVNRSLTLGVGDATMQVDEQVIYNASDLRVGLFTGESMS